MHVRRRGDWVKFCQPRVARWIINFRLFQDQQGQAAVLVMMVTAPARLPGHSALGQQDCRVASIFAGLLTELSEELRWFCGHPSPNRMRWTGGADAPPSSRLTMRLKYLH